VVTGFVDQGQLGCSEPPAREAECFNRLLTCCKSAGCRGRLSRRLLPRPGTSAGAPSHVGPPVCTPSTDPKVSISPSPAAALGIVNGAVNLLACRVAVVAYCTQDQSFETDGSTACRRGQDPHAHTRMAVSAWRLALSIGHIHPRASSPLAQAARNGARHADARQQGAAGPWHAAGCGAALRAARPDDSADEPQLPLIQVRQVA
jgi:hypothetical protein